MSKELDELESAFPHTTHNGWDHLGMTPREPVADHAPKCKHSMRVLLDQAAKEADQQITPSDDRLLLRIRRRHARRA